MIVVEATTRTVYKAVGGRRAFLTRASAYREAAWRAMRAKHGRPDPEDGGSWPEDTQRVVDRLVRWLTWRDDCGGAAR